MTKWEKHEFALISEVLSVQNDPTPTMKPRPFNMGRNLFTSTSLRPRSVSKKEKGPGDELRESCHFLPAFLRRKPKFV